MTKNFSTLQISRKPLIILVGILLGVSGGIVAAVNIDFENMDLSLPSIGSSGDNENDVTVGDLSYLKIRDTDESLLSDYSNKQFDFTNRVETDIDTSDTQDDAHIILNSDRLNDLEIQKQKAIEKTLELDNQNKALEAANQNKLIRSDNSYNNLGLDRSYNNNEAKEILNNDGCKGTDIHDEYLGCIKEPSNSFPKVAFNNTIQEQSNNQPQQNKDSVTENEKSLTKPLYSIGLNRLINVTISNNINTSNEGIVRAISNRGFYTEDSKVLLVPKGSVVFGAYAFGSSRAQTKIQIIWTHIKLPTNKVLTLTGAGTLNATGESEADAIVSNNYGKLLANIGLLSLVGQLANNSNATQGSFANSLSQQFGQTSVALINSSINEKPILKLKQGTTLNVLLKENLKIEEYSD